jgi:prevent-host-death family protein
MDSGNPLRPSAGNIMLNIMKSANSRSDVISTNDLRFDFGRVIKAVKLGKSLTLTYRNKPLARIVPLATQEELRDDDPLFRLHELAEPLGPLTNREIDQAIYGR